MKVRGCVGLLVYEADTFTLAILFSNPSNYNFYPMELAMEISLLKVHLGDLETTYTRMYKGQPATADKNAGYHRVKLGACQEPVTVSAGHVRVTATMSNSTKSIVKVILENLEPSSGLTLGGQHPKGKTPPVHVTPDTKRDLLPPQ
ncbi:delta-sagatoxin-srs1a-like isoform x1 [Limosa lapponica baueri]|uniref:Delta-sagatoxin-srs1a-like isoform x1 n=1 Tax=Limosa lapponica baueri TaxID=1758121 RepID=A0A2I0T0N2_LIMLA|nr:delta-sagatoxin-srs1a-like isoform x1 [Limosa lapponica baueri]